jgi:hypothetical protein
VNELTPRQAEALRVVNRASHLSAFGLGGVLRCGHGVAMALLSELARDGLVARSGDDFSLTARGLDWIDSYGEEKE